MPNYTNGHGRYNRTTLPRSTRSRINYVWSVCKPEIKWFDTTFTSSLITSSTPVVTPLDSITQGTGQNNRIGDSIHAAGGYFKFTLYRGVADSTFRMIHFIWKSNDVPTVASVLQVPTDVNSPLNKANGKTLKILKDTTYTLATGQSALQVDKIYNDLYFTNRYDGNPVATTSMNGYYVLMISDVVSSANSPTINYYHRLNYIDS